ncbi:sigma-70 family RNA polymerase sigma factor [Nocardioides sp. TF02-7]|uniref:sigma-70 family RNA polymerase sigma factor n=1 Tax=Nocardioides sp. TF02-7 TaxID=2917724 RepID=UPI001F051F68|nr:sigma-70 family RNA polymerase sigma factor [Nocardioides sp. TF02-7]UMG91615.1 sigma-70 family RNA polymerase sigma factor [Nocardioides sp. TF02-7]
MSDEASQAEEFQDQRARLLAIASRVLGDRTEAEDVVQEAWLRLARQQPGSVDNVAGWLTTVVGRLSIDALRSRSARREVPYDDRPPAPVVTEDVVPAGDDPADQAVQAESLGLALLVVLGSLGPEERLAFVLHDLFAVPFADVGPIIGKSSDAAKMAASRARRKVQGATPPAADLQQQRRVVDAFLAAARDGDFEALLSVLDPDLTWQVENPSGATVTRGRDELVRAVLRGGGLGYTARRVLVDGRPGILAWGPTGEPAGLMRCTVENGRMTRIESLTGRERLRGVDLPPTPAPER